MDEKPRRKRATFLQWLVVLAVIAVCGELLHQHVVRSWYGGNTPGWYASYLKWQHRHGFPEWFPF